MTCPWLSSLNSCSAAAPSSSSCSHLSLLAVLKCRMFALHLRVVSTAWKPLHSDMWNQLGPPKWDKQRPITQNMLQQGSQPPFICVWQWLRGIAAGVVVWFPGLVATDMADFLSWLLQTEAKAPGSNQSRNDWSMAGQLSFSIFGFHLKLRTNRRKVNMLPKPITEYVLLLVSPPPAFPCQLPPIRAHLKPSLCSLWSLPAPLPAFKSLPNANDSTWLPCYSKL